MTEEHSNDIILPENKKEARYCPFKVTKGLNLGKPCMKRILTDNEYCSDHTRTMKRRNKIMQDNERKRSEQLNLQGS